MTSRSTKIRYRYAKGSDRSIVDVRKLDSEKRHDLAPYLCLGCGGELIPNLGQKKVKHFSHKSACACSRETYLHKLAKEEFLRIYSQCLANDSPFIFESTFPAICNHFEKDFGESCKTKRLLEVDLTKHFSSIELEQSYSGFIPDILLSNEDASEVIFVEIAVSHRCEENKIKLGERIVEIEVTDEDDVAQIQNRRLEERSPWIRTYNFNKKNQNGDICKGQCQRLVNLFIIFESKKSIILQLPPAEAFDKSRHHKVRHCELLGFAQEDADIKSLYKYKVREAHFDKKPIKNCNLCKYHGSEGWEGGVFCKFRKESMGSNEAVDCEYYRAFKNMQECQEADKANEEYIKKNELQVADGISIPIFNRKTFLQ